MIRLHVLYHKIIGRAISQLALDIVKPLMGKPCVDRVHDRNFCVNDNIRIVRHAVFNDILTLEQVDIMVIHAHISDVFCNLHFKLLPGVCPIYML